MIQSMARPRRHVPLSLFPLFGVALMLAFAALSVWPEEAEARRFGGGSSFGSRGSRTANAPRQAPQRQSAMQQNQRDPSQTGAGPRRPGMMGGLLGGIGGFMLGGMIGSMLFGGGFGGGFGMLDLLLIGGAAFLIFRWWRSRQAAHAPMGGGGASGAGQGQWSGDGPLGRQGRDEEPGMGGGSPETFSTTGAPDEVTQGVGHITAMDPSFSEADFLEGARRCFEMVQSAWADWRVDHLRPLIADQLWPMIESQAADGQARGARNVIDKIQFHAAEISEAWQESGQDYLTVVFDVSMIDLVTDASGQVIEGNPHVPIRVQEFWTFTRPVGAADPNWRLSAVQQPGGEAGGAA